MSCSKNNASAKNQKPTGKKIEKANNRRSNFFVKNPIIKNPSRKKPARKIIFVNPGLFKNQV
jgi:hypothetical protein